MRRELRDSVRRSLPAVGVLVLAAAGWAAPTSAAPISYLKYLTLVLGGYGDKVDFDFNVRGVDRGGKIVPEVTGIVITEDQDGKPTPFLTVAVQNGEVSEQDISQTLNVFQQRGFEIRKKEYAELWFYTRRQGQGDRRGALEPLGLNQYPLPNGATGLFSAAGEQFSEIPKDASLGQLSDSIEDAVVAEASRRATGEETPQQVIDNSNVQVEKVVRFNDNIIERFFKEYDIKEDQQKIVREVLSYSVKEQMYLDILAEVSGEKHREFLAREDLEGILEEYHMSSAGYEELPGGPYIFAILNSDDNVIAITNLEWNKSENTWGLGAKSIRELLDQLQELIDPNQTKAIRADIASKAPDVMKRLSEDEKVIDEHSEHTEDPTKDPVSPGDPDGHGDDGASALIDGN